MSTPTGVRHAQRLPPMRPRSSWPCLLAQVALSLPKLELLRTEVRALGEDCWRVRLAVATPKSR